MFELLSCLLGSENRQKTNPRSGQFYERAFLEATVVYNFSSCAVYFPDIRQNVLVFTLQPPSVESKVSTVHVCYIVVTLLF